MKIRKALLFTTILVLTGVLFAACSKVDEPNFESEILTELIEIRDNKLYVTPFELVLIYCADNEHTWPWYEDRPPWTSDIRGYAGIFERNDAEGLVEFGLSFDDFLGGFTTAGKGETLSFEITRDTVFRFHDTRGLFPESHDPISNNWFSTTDVEKFLSYTMSMVIHFVEVQNGRVFSVSQYFEFTI